MKVVAPFNVETYGDSLPGLRDLVNVVADAGAALVAIEALTRPESKVQRFSSRGLTETVISDK